jgi:hypothetical protein
MLDGCRPELPPSEMYFFNEVMYGRKQADRGSGAGKTRNLQLRTAALIYKTSNPPPFPLPDLTLRPSPSYPPAAAAAGQQVQAV